MLIYSPIPRTFLRRWFDLVRDQPGHLTPSRYLVLGPENAALLAFPEPSVASVTDLLRTLRDLDAEVLGYAAELAHALPPGREALLELAVDELVGADGEWQHPSQVLDRPRPKYRELVPICERRLQQAADDQRDRVLAVTEKVTRAARLAEQARHRRERWQQGRRRSPRRPPE